MQRVVVDGRHLALGGEPFPQRGVVYDDFISWPSPSETAGQHVPAWHAVAAMRWMAGR
jgi:hypothetical protein